MPQYWGTVSPYSPQYHYRITCPKAWVSGLAPGAVTTKHLTRKATKEADNQVCNKLPQKSHKSNVKPLNNKTEAVTASHREKGEQLQVLPDEISVALN